MTATNLPTGTSTSIPFRLCSAAPRIVKWPLSSSRRGGIAILRVPERNWPVTEPLTRITSFAVPSATTSPPCSPAPGPMSTMVGRPHHLLVVLDDEDGVAERLEPLERPDQLVVVALVQADRGLVEDVEDADELGADLRRQP